jgi:hypothetical protein
MEDAIVHWTVMEQVERHEHFKGKMGTMFKVLDRK